MDRFEFSCLRIFVQIFKTIVEYGFFCKIRQKETVSSMEQRLESFGRLMHKNSISGITNKGGVYPHSQNDSGGGSVLV